MNWLYEIPGQIVGFMFAAGAWLSDITSDIFWDTATSMPVLVLLGVIFLVAFAVAHIPVVAQLIPGVAAWQRLAVMAQVVSIAALLFLIGFRTADGRNEAGQLKNDLAWSEFQLDQQRQLAEAADQLKSEADQRAADAQGELNEYKTKFNPTSCPPPAGYLDWLHPLQRRGRPARTGAVMGASQHNLVARLRALGGKHQ